MSSSSNAILADNSAGKITFWCSGLPHDCDRPFTDLEGAELERTRARLHRWTIRFAISAAATLVVSALVTWALLNSGAQPATLHDIEGVPETVIWLCFSCGAATTQIYLAYRCATHRVAIDSDLIAGTVSVFRGVLSERSRLEPTQHTLLAAGLLHLDSNIIQTVELLKMSRIIWRVNGVPVRRTIQPTITEVASAPAFAAIAAEWLEPISKHDETVLYGGRRELSDNEKRELERFIRRLVTRLATSSLPVALLSLAIASSMAYDHDIRHDLMFMFFFLGGLANLSLYLVQLRQARRFDSDLKVGYVGIRRIGRSDSKAGEESRVEPDIEFLPVTGMLWTKSGEPAVWRRGGTG